jgi:hypothetical protein
MDSSSIYLPITPRVRAGANPAEPADPPIINVITQRHRLAKPKELGLNVHGNSRPNTSMARLGRQVNPPFATPLNRR